MTNLNHENHAINSYDPNSYLYDYVIRKPDELEVIQAEETKAWRPFYRGEMEVLAIENAIEWPPAGRRYRESRNERAIRKELARHVKRMHSLGIIIQ